MGRRIYGFRVGERPERCVRAGGLKSCLRGWRFRRRRAVSPTHGSENRENYGEPFFLFMRRILFLLSAGKQSHSRLFQAGIALAGDILHLLGGLTEVG